MTEKSPFQKGDVVRIILGPIDKVGRIGIVTIPAINGAIIQLEDGRATPVQSCHLELVKSAEAAREGTDG